MIQAYDIYGYDTGQNMNKWTKLIENKLSMYQENTASCLKNAYKNRIYIHAAQI